MKIVQLHAENFKRLGVVEITPEGNVVTVGGNNGNGKTSVLDAIAVALQGRAVAPPKPIREGEEKCTIRLDMGDLVVTRVFREKDGGKRYTDTIKVEDPEGRSYPKPQNVLSALLGEIGFDPFEFMKLKPGDQVDRLLQMVPLTVDLDELRDADAEDYTERRDVNREVARLEAQVGAIEEEELPKDPHDRQALQDQLGNAANTNSALQREIDRRGREASRANDLDAQAQAANERAIELRRQAAIESERYAELSGEAKELREELDALEPVAEFVVTDEIRAKLREADEQAEVIRRQERRAELVEQLNAQRAKSAALTEAMEAREKERNAALAQAEMPVEGLGIQIDEDGDARLTWQGLPFDKDQISTAAQLRVSTAIGMAANPELRVLRIKDGALLDSESMKLLAELADAEDFQLWVEVVGEGEGVGIVMENGTIRGSAEAADAAETESTETGEEYSENNSDEDGQAPDDLFGGESE